MYDERDNGAGFATGVLMGAIVGVGVALLFAPKAGVELRDDLGGSVSSVRGAVARRYRDLARRAGVELDDLEVKAERAAASFEANARELLDTAKGRARRPRRSESSAADA